MSAPLAFIHDFLRALSRLGKQDPLSYCDLVDVVGPSTLRAENDSLLTIIELEGAKRLVGDEELDQVTQTLGGALSSMLSKPGRMLEVMFTQEPASESQGLGEVAREMRAMRQGARASGLDMEDILAEMEDIYKKNIWNEKTLLCCWTFPSVLSPAQRKEAANLRTVSRKKAPPTNSSVQPSVPPIGDLIFPHESFATTLAATLSDDKRVGFRARILDATEAMRMIRWQIDPQFTAEDWVPRLPSSKVPLLAAQRPGIDPGSFLQPSLASQLFPRHATISSLQEVTVGAKTYLPISVSVPPMQKVPFNLLLRKLRTDGIPFRVKIQLSGGGLTQLNMRAEAASVLARFSQNNTQVDGAFKTLKAASLRGDAIVGMRMDFVTWAKSGDSTEVRRRASVMARAIQSWGQCETDEIVGNPLEGMLSTVAGYTSSSVAPMAAAPLTEIIPLLPLSRPMSPFPGGEKPLMTPDMRLFPMTSCSAVQTFWCDLYVGPPGFGKSMRLNAANLGLALNQSNEGLPFIRGIDVGYSATGFTSALIAALPDNMRHLVIHRRMRNTKEYRINPLETPLGFRYPTADLRQWMNIFFLMALREPGVEVSYEGVSGAVERALDEVYKRYSDDPAASARRYSKNRSLLVDDAVDRYGYEVTPHTTWWDIEDYLVGKGDFRAATAAHRYAVPSLKELASMCKERAIADFYSMTTPSGEKVSDYVWRRLVELCSEFEIIDGPTELELGDARVVVLDVEDIAPEGSLEAQRKAGLMYALCARAITADLFLHRDDINQMIGDMKLPVGSGGARFVRSDEMLERLRDYHIGRAEVMGRSPKRLVMDEYKRAASCPGMMAITESWVRLGRKNRIHEIFASQLAGDFPDSIVKLASSVTILGKGNEKMDEFAGRFGLDQTAQDIIATRLSGPTAAGAPMLQIYETKSGRFQFLLLEKLGAILMWAFSTHKEDVELREELYRSFDAALVRRVLSKRFPNGSAEKDIERRMAKLREQGGTGLTEDKIKGIATKGLIADMLKECGHVARGDFAAAA